MAFVQIIEFQTSKPDEMQEVGGEWERATEGRRTVRRRILCEDRDRPGHFFNVVFFDSYEAAMKNSSLPETEGLSAKLVNLTDGPPTFYNLDVVEDRS